MGVVDDNVLAWLHVQHEDRTEARSGQLSLAGCFQHEKTTTLGEQGVTEILGTGFEFDLGGGGHESAIIEGVSLRSDFQDLNSAR